ncbi:MAG: AlbA family DNA-binding domain-containing protein [Nitritalea sp.]
MQLSDVHRLAARGEGLHIEFKKKATHPEKIVRELVALANTEGGHLLIGVDDDGTVSGQRFIEEEIFVMENAIEKYIRPALGYELSLFKLNEKKGVAVFYVACSPHRPHLVKEGAQRQAYVRVADRSIKASREMWEILKRIDRPDAAPFTYGEKEMKLMQLLQEKEQITLQEYARAAELPIFLASRTLVRLVLANVLEILPREEQQDLFQMKAT